MKVSKYINKLALINIVKKKQRTLLSLIAISLSVAIIFTSLTLFTNVFSLTKIPNKETTGEYHYILNSNEGEPLTRHQTTYDYDLNTYSTYQDQSLALHQLTPLEEESPLPIIIETGTLPNANDEIVVPNQLGLKVGDTLSLELIESNGASNGIYQVDSSVFNQTPSKTASYKVVGVYEATELFAQLTTSAAPVYVMDNNDSTNRNVIIRDDQVQRADSLTMISEIFHTDTQEIQMNNSAISYDTVKNYLKDTTTLLVMFAAIVLIAVMMSVISLKNVFIITDKDRRKEFGLLKSIGATPKDINHLLKIELSALGLLGAFLGIVFGILVSYFVLKMFIKQLALPFAWSMIMNPYTLISSFLIGFGLMLILGHHSYSRYIHSSAIDDLKDVAYNYDPPRQRQSYMSKSFSWKMFLIYNGRLKKQTRNIFQSFALLILTTVIFFAVFLSNFSYKNETASVNYDFSIENSIPMNTATPINLGIYDELYQAIDDRELIPESMDIKRQVLGPYIQYPVDAINQDNFKTYKSNARVSYVENTDENGIMYGQIQTATLLLDHQQLDKLKPYVVAGSLDDLDNGGMVVVLRKGSKVAEGLFDQLKVGDRLYMTESLETLYENVAAIALVDEGAEGLYCDYDEYPRIVAMSSNYGIKYQQYFTVKEAAKIVLSNKATVTKATLAIDKAISNSGAQDTYTYDNVLLRAQENKVVSFMIESLLYPLFFLLFVISVLNINNVLVGNVHLKRGDISIMKSVGMTSYQLYKLFVFEYLEGYINASALVTAIFIPICILESKLKLSAAFQLGQNILLTLIVSIMIFDILLVAVLVLISLNNIRRVQAIENMKDVV